MTVYIDIDREGEGERGIKHVRKKITLLSSVEMTYEEVNNNL
jgi:hypothetical protein